MGQLIAKRYRTSMMAYLADHTYVECGAGKAWGCFGGSQNGEAINAGEGSTARADAIAEPNGEAGVGRYLIDGVCHQAANRILLPANRLVTEARGYWLSVAIFGTYGRSNFNMHPGVTGDLDSCTGMGTFNVKESKYSPDVFGSIRLIRSNKASISKFNFKTSSLALANFNVNRFMKDVSLTLPRKSPKSSLSGLQLAKSTSEMFLEFMGKELRNDKIKAGEYVREFDRMTDKFQDDAANALASIDYERLFRVRPEVRIRLSDPKAVDQTFGRGVFEAAATKPPR